MGQGKGEEGDLKSNLIGQFGVGFYSAFMVGERLTVVSQSADASARPAHWTSTGDGEYVVGHAAEASERGTRVVVNLRPECKEFAVDKAVADVIARHSNFVNFPIVLNGKRLNPVQAIWAKSKSDVTPEQYDGFFRHIVPRGSSASFENPFFRLHFSTDAPLDMKALLYFPGTHEEKSGMPAMKRGVALYSRKVLIQPESEILPMWLRFVVGVVDSADIPLNISRETMQVRVCVCAHACVHGATFGRCCHRTRRC